MNTIQIKGSYKRVTQFLKEGGQLLENKVDNKIIISYFNYLKSIGNKDNTINLKLMFICFLENFLIKNNKTLKKFSKENIYNYFRYVVVLRDSDIIEMLRMNLEGKIFLISQLI